MTRNPILEDIYEVREKLLADAEGDVHKYLEGVRKREASSGRLLKPMPQRSGECVSKSLEGAISKKPSTDPLIADSEVSRDDGPVDLASNHDDYLYGDEA